MGAVLLCADVMHMYPCMFPDACACICGNSIFHSLHKGTSASFVCSVPQSSLQCVPVQSLETNKCKIQGSAPLCYIKQRLPTYSVVSVPSGWFTQLNLRSCTILKDRTFSEVSPTSSSEMKGRIMFMSVKNSVENI